MNALVQYNTGNDELQLEEGASNRELCLNTRTPDMTQETSPKGEVVLRRRGVRARTRPASLEASCGRERDQLPPPGNVLPTSYLLLPSDRYVT